MATDYALLTRQLTSFYDFAGKEVLFMGAAGRQLLDMTVPMRQLVAVDSDGGALQRLREEVAARGLGGLVEVVHARFEEVTREVDVVYVEFCLHEMPDPLAALGHARALAPDVVVFDHAVGSEWARCADEDTKVARSSEAMTRLGPRRRDRHDNEQRFATRDELVLRVASQGERAVARAKAYPSGRDVVIPMGYELVLL
jgi:hypothetical protein